MPLQFLIVHTDTHTHSTTKTLKNEQQKIRELSLDVEFQIVILPL